MRGENTQVMRGENTSSSSSVVQLPIQEIIWWPLYVTFLGTETSGILCGLLLCPIWCHNTISARSLKANANKHVTWHCFPCFCVCVCVCACIHAHTQMTNFNYRDKDLFSIICSSDVKHAWQLSQATADTCY
jgi:hypothetical protein